jgi:hypothetical protein
MVMMGLTVRDTSEKGIRPCSARCARAPYCYGWLLVVGDPNSVKSVGAPPGPLP